MSHVTTVDLHIRDLDCLAKAAEDCGLELRRDQTTYAWWGRSMGDYPLPDGYTEADLGKCAHALCVPGVTGQNGPNGPWEIGVVDRRDGKKGFALQFDFFGSAGATLRNHVGRDFAKLKQRYAFHVTKKQARREGFRVKTIEREDGSITMELEKQHVA